MCTGKCRADCLEIQVGEFMVIQEIYMNKLVGSGGDNADSKK